MTKTTTFVLPSNHAKALIVNSHTDVTCIQELGSPYHSLGFLSEHDFVHIHNDDIVGLIEILQELGRRVGVIETND